MVNFPSVIPGILEKDWDEIDKKIQAVSSFSKAIHIDLIDGKFAQNATYMDPKPFEKYKNLDLELHMMVNEPINYLKPFADAGFKKFIGHVEMMSDQAEFIAQAQLLGDAGLALDINKPLNRIEIPLYDLDVLLLMTVKAGASGQEFDKKGLEKMKEIDKSSFVPIEIDGGVDDKTIKDANEEGGSFFVVNSFLFSHDPKEQFEKLTNILKGGDAS
jgi:ribulose-phosphate 3-epimerase